MSPIKQFIIDALDDAIWQANHLLKIRRVLRGDK